MSTVLQQMFNVAQQLVRGRGPQHEKRRSLLKRKKRAWAMLLASIHGKLFPLVLRPVPGWKPVEYKLLQLLGLAFVPPPPTCRIRTVRAVIWMCSPVRINLCVRLLRSSVQIKLLRYPQRPILEMLQTLPSSPQLPSALPSSP